MSSQAVVIPAGAARIELLVGDITRIAVDAIVNAANSALAAGGGVDGAIHRIGGPDLMRELEVIREKIGRCQTGGAVVTTAGRLPAKFVFHAVGPVYRDGSHGESDLLRSCYTTCLDLARERSVHSISFPSISSGVYGYPLAKAATVAVGAVRDWLESNAAPVKVVKLIQFSPKDHEIYLRAVPH